MSDSTVAFYLNPDFWKDEQDIGVSVLYVSDSDLTELGYIAETFLNSTLKSLKLAEALPSDVHSELVGMVKYSVFLVTGELEQLIGWMSDKPRSWTNGVWRKLRHGYMYEPYQENQVPTARDVSPKSN